MSNEATGHPITVTILHIDQRVALKMRMKQKVIKSFIWDKIVKHYCIRHGKIASSGFHFRDALRVRVIYIDVRGARAPSSCT